MELSRIKILVIKMLRMSISRDRESQRMQEHAHAQTCAGTHLACSLIFNQPGGGIYGRSWLIVSGRWAEPSWIVNGSLIERCIRKRVETGRELVPNSTLLVAPRVCVTAVQYTSSLFFRYILRNNQNRCVCAQVLLWPVVSGLYNFYKGKN